MALEMILGIKLFRDDEAGSPKVASVVPLAFPILAGAGTMTSLVALQASTNGQIFSSNLNKLYFHINCT